MKHSQYTLEKIPFGTARIKILKTKQGEYGMHGQTGWDDTPYWEFHDAWIVTAQAYGNLDYRLKQRKNAKKEHIGTLRINLVESEILETQNKTEERALNLAQMLEQKGFETRIKFGEEHEPRLLGRNYIVEEQLPNFIKRQLKPRIENLYLTCERDVKRNDT